VDDRKSAPCGPMK